ncbi:MAG: hypothetical protein KA778_18010, partial [Burkholderiaceae bacterium]|nr:hypothetical protein [Burkholderiaceae bacterium]
MLRKNHRPKIAPARHLDRTVAAHAQPQRRLDPRQQPLDALEIQVECRLSRARDRRHTRLPGTDRILLAVPEHLR